jgi:predicted dehydrogenase
MKKLRWGILGTAKIARTLVIPAIQASEANEVVAIASRDLALARAVAKDLHIPTAYGSHDDLLADPDIDVVYNPLPNHLHVPLSIKALQAGKHILCEKPVGLNAENAQALINAAGQYPHLKAMEAFMYRFHPQWRRVEQLVQDHALGTVRSVHAQFTYFKDEPDNIRNKPEWGGGGLMDIGCYCISAARLIFNAEPLRICVKLQQHPEYGVDVLASGILEFDEGNATFSCATQVEASQFVVANGEHGSLHIESPFLRREAEPSRVVVTHNKIADVLEFDGGDHYLDMIDAFSQAILDGEPTPTPLTDALANMKVIDAAFASAQKGGWIDVN